VNPPALTLTERNLKVIALVTEGLKNPEIAKKLGLSEGTVKDRMLSIYDNLGFHNRVEVALWYIKNYE
jgi:DNA-binding NarL/FixJ family response regulator